MDAKVLFFATPATSAAINITTGPSTGKVWTVSKLYINSTSSSTITLSQYLSTSATIQLRTAFVVKSSSPTDIGPLVLENGHKLISSNSAGIHLIAFGLEESV